MCGSVTKSLTLVSLHLCRIRLAQAKSNTSLTQTVDYFFRFTICYLDLYFPIFLNIFIRLYTHIVSCKSFCPKYADESEQFADFHRHVTMLKNSIVFQIDRHGFTALANRIICIVPNTGYGCWSC